MIKGIGKDGCAISIEENEIMNFKNLEQLEGVIASLEKMKKQNFFPTRLVKLPTKEFDPKTDL